MIMGKLSGRVIVASVAISLVFGITFPHVAKSNTVTFDNLDPINTSLYAYKAVNDFIDARPNLTISPVLYVGPNMGSRSTKIQLTGLNRVAKLWSDFVKPDKLNVILFSDQDLSWADQKQTELTGEWLQPDAIPSKRFLKYGCNQAGMYLPGLLLFCIKNYEIEPNSSEYYAELHKFAHEYTHFMEMNYKDWMSHAKGKGIGTRNPCWIEEGFATFYGFAVGSDPQYPDGKFRREFTRNLTFNYDRNRNNPEGTLAAQIALGNVAETKRLFGMLENTPWPCDETENAYALGSIAAEALVAVKGQEGMNNFYKASARNGNWRASFQEAFGLSVDSFYEKLTPYLASQFNRNNFVYATPTPTPSVSPITPTPAPTPTPQQLNISPSASPTTSKVIAAPKLITITCVKGKTIKKIKGVSPKCPAGYKKK